MREQVRIDEFKFLYKVKTFFRKYFTKLLLFILFIHMKMTFFEFSEKKKFQFRTLIIVKAQDRPYSLYNFSVHI